MHNITVIDEVSDRPKAEDIDIQVVRNAALLAADNLVDRLDLGALPSTDEPVRLFKDNWPGVSASIGRILNAVAYPRATAAMGAADRYVDTALPAMIEAAKSGATAADITTGLSDPIAVRLCKSAIPGWVPPLPDVSPAAAATIPPTTAPPDIPTASGRRTRARRSTQNHAAPIAGASAASSEAPAPAPTPAPEHDSEPAPTLHLTMEGATKESELTVRLRSAADCFLDGNVAAPIRARFNFKVPFMDYGGPYPGNPAIDPHYVFNTGALFVILRSIVNRENLWLTGHTSTGKTSLIRQVAARLNWPYFSVNMEDGITAAQLYGSNKIVRDISGSPTTRFVDGVLPLAMRVGGLLVLEEITVASPDVLFLLQSVLDGSPLRLLDDSGRLVTPHPNFRIIATDNTKGRGDPLRIYPNCKEQSLASLNRWTFVEINYQPPAMEAANLTARFPTVPADVIDGVTQIAKLSRNAFTAGEAVDLVTMRDLSKIANEFGNIRNMFSNNNECLTHCLQVYLLSRLDEPESMKMQEHIRTVFNISFTVPTGNTP